MTGHVCVRRRVGIVGDHHDRLVEVLVQALQDLQNLCSGMAVEIACGLIGQQKSRVADDGAGNGHALFLAAGKLLGQMADAFFQSNQF